MDNDDIEKSVKDSEDELYKQPISFFPQTKKNATISSRDEDGLGGRPPHQGSPPQREGSENTIEEYAPLNVDPAKK